MSSRTLIAIYKLCKTESLSLYSEYIHSVIDSTCMDRQMDGQTDYYTELYFSTGTHFQNAFPVKLRQQKMGTCFKI